MEREDQAKRSTLRDEGTPNQTTNGWFCRSEDEYSSLRGINSANFIFGKEMVKFLIKFLGQGRAGSPSAPCLVLVRPSDNVFAQKDPYLGSVRDFCLSQDHPCNADRDSRGRTSLFWNTFGGDSLRQSSAKIHAAETFETNVTTANPVSQGLTPSLTTTYKANVTKPKNDCLTVTIVSNCNIL